LALERAGPSLWSVSSWAEVCFLTERHHKALEAGEQALTRHRETGERGLEGWALHLLGDITVSREPLKVGRAESYYHEAMALAEELGMRPLAAHCHLGLGTLYRRTGDSAKAEEHLTTAATMYREMGMSFWLEKAAAAHGSTTRR